MAKPRFLVENHLDTRQNSDHVLSANEEEAGHEVFRVGTYRRSDRNYWTPTTDNSSAWVKVDATESKSADTIVIDRNSNVEGETLTLERSSDDTTWTQVFQVTVPSFSEDADLETSPGAMMDDGAWGFFFGSASNRYWRLTVSAMGAGKRPKIGGLYLGASWQPSFYLARPWGWGMRRLEFDTSRSDTAWISASRPARRREMDLNLQLKSHTEYDNSARYHIEDLFLTKTPMWIWPDTANGERGWVAMPDTGTSGFQVQDGWGFPQGTIRAVEHEPALI